MSFRHTVSLITILLFVNWWDMELDGKCMKNRKSLIMVEEVVDLC